MLAIIYGGQSLEHQVSIKSAKSILEVVHAVDIYIDKNGHWYRDGKKASIHDCLSGVEVVFPIIHGTSGEDGTIQGFLEFYGKKYVGCKVKASAICMDKDVTKKILNCDGITTAQSKTFYSMNDIDGYDFSFPCIVKACSLGSTYGVYKVDSDPIQYVKKCFTLDTKVLIEEYVEGREIFCSVMDTDEGIYITNPCEIVYDGDIFSYDDKYKEKPSVQYHYNATDFATDEIKSLVKRVYTILGCESMARIDLFVKDDGKIVVNEVNTLPGFTPKSLFPQSFIQEEFSYLEIIENLVNRARKSTSLKNCATNSLFSKEGILVN